MRKVHRWLAVIFGIFLLWISATGFLSQVGSLVNNGGFEEERPAPKQAAASGNMLIPAARAHEGEHENEVTPADKALVAAEHSAFICPADMMCRPKRTPKPGEWNVGFLHHLHSGEAFGPLGVVISMMSGLALLFFAFSGLWMYIQMYRRRSHRKSHPKRLFW